jgi:hypothetical protein
MFSLYFAASPPPIRYGRWKFSDRAESATALKRNLQNADFLPHIAHQSDATGVAK